jgi:signal transduction histidine kinase
LQTSRDKELGDLRALIAQLLAQLEQLQQQHDDAQARESRDVKLRQANEHLVLATLSAQDKQASAEASMERQTRFLSMLAHELRNPLQPIASASTLLGKLVSANPALLRLQTIIGRQVIHMTRLIDDLLDASRISSGKIDLEVSILSLAEVVAAAVEASQPLLDNRQQRLHVELPTIPVIIHGDRSRLVQALSNLLNNASKFSPENETIELSAQLAGETVQISVRDQGAGIAAELQPFIFDLFTQGLQSPERAQGGLGIGLALVRSLVEMHGGTVRVHSDGIGLGSIFTVLLPVNAAVTGTAAQLSQLTSRRRLRILLVEDNLDAAETLCQLLELGGHAVTQRHDGVGAVELALTQQFDVVICDIGLPGLNGLAVIKRIRAALPDNPPVLIATSGYDQPQDRTRALRSGFDHYLVKPVAFESLLALIELHLH